MTNKSKAILAIFLGSVLGGAVSSVTKISLVSIPPFSFSFIRFFIASFCLLPFFLRSRVKVDRKFRSLVLLSLLPTLNVALFVLGIRTTTASISQMLYAGTTILVGIFGYFLFKNKISPRRWFFILIGLAGVSLVVLLPLIQKNIPFSGDLKGNLLISLGVIVWSLYIVYSKQFQKEFSPLILTSLFIFVSTIVFFFLALLEVRTYGNWWAGLTMTSVIGVLYTSIPATVLTYLLNQYAIQFAGSVIASFSFYLLPIFAYISAFFLLGEQLTAGLAIGTVLVFLSVVLTTYIK